MSKTVQLKRGNANVSASYVGAEGEITVNTSDYTLNIHDGVTPGGYVVTGIGGGNIGNLSFSDQTIAGLQPNNNIVIDTANANLSVEGNITVTGNVTAQSFYGDGSNLTGTYSNVILQSVLSNYGDPINTSSNVTAAYFLGNGSQLTGINVSNLGNVRIDNQTIYGINESTTPLVIGTSNVYIFNSNLRNATLGNIVVDGSATFSSLSTGSMTAQTLYANSSIGVIALNTPTGYFFTSNANTIFSNTGLIHRAQSVPDPNVSVLALLHDTPVALFYSNKTSELIGNLSIIGTDRSAGVFPNANVSIYANVNSYSQVVHQNLSEGGKASTDFVATANNGDDSTYYIDLGIAGNTHADPDFFGDTVSYNDAYLYVTAYDQSGPSIGNIGNLIIGSTNGIVKTFIGNTAEANVVTIVDSTGLLPGANVAYDLGSTTRQWRDLWLSNSTFYLGGVPITVTANGQLSVNGNTISGGGNVSLGNFIFNGNSLLNLNGSSFTNGDLVSGETASLTIPVNGSNSSVQLLNTYGNLTISAGETAVVTATWTFDNTGNLNFTHGSKINEVLSPVPGNYALALTGTGIIDQDQQLLIYPTSLDANHLHLTTGNLYNTELYLGNDNLYVKLSNIGDVIINSNDNSGNTAQWTFGNDGTTTFPGGNLTSNTSLRLTTTFGNYRTVEYQTAGVWDLYVEDVATGPNDAWSWINVTFKDNLINKPQVFIENQKANDGIALRWTFDENGNITLPSNSSVIMYANGQSILTGLDSSGNYGNANVAAYLPTYTGNLSVGNIIMATASTASKIQFKATGSTNGAIIYDDSGSLILSPNTTYSPTAGVGIGGLGYLLAPNGSRNLTLNYGSVNGQVGVQTNLVVGTTLTGGNLTVANNIVASGNITGSYFIGNGALLTGISASGNYDNSNVVTLLSSFGSNTITTTGNVSASYFIGNGRQLTGLAVGSNTQVQFNDSGSLGAINTFTFDKNGNVLTVGSATSSGTLKVADIQSVTGAIRLIPSSNITYSYGNFHPLFSNTYDLGLSTNRWRNFFANTANVVSLSSSGNITADYFIGNGALLTGISTGNYGDSNVATLLSNFGSNNISTTGNISGNTAGFAIGYRDIPQVVFTSNATLALTDAGKHYFSSNSANVITVPNNATVSFNIGAAITIVQQGSANLTITPDTGVTMYLSGNSTSAARTLGNYGMATLMKVATDTWFINGTGVV
jgi:hypothetical protein